MTKKTTVNIEHHDRLTQILAEEIRKVSKRKKKPIESMSREFFLSNRKSRVENLGFVHKYWGPIKAQAMGKDAPPVEPIPEQHAVHGVSSYFGPLGDLKGQWVKTQKVKESSEDALVRLLEDLPKRVPARKGNIPLSKASKSDDLLACYVLGDPHLGLLAWKPESGASFDLQIAEKLMCTAVRDLVLRGPRTRKAMLISLGDLFHADNSQQHTTRGSHSLDVDGRMSKVLAVGMTIITTMIDALLEHHEEVEVDCIQGNHDQYTSLVFSIALNSYYRNEPRIKIPVNPAARHYHRFENNLIGCVHGDRNKLETLGEIMATEESKAWGATEHRTWFVGHVHHSQVKELRGCTVETFRTLAARDSWHAGQGYNAQRDIRRIVYHAQYGEISREVAGLQYLESLVP